MNKENNQPLLLLHGALGNKEQFDGILTNLEDHFDVYCMDFEGHGESGSTDSPFRISYFVENVLGFLEEHTIEKANIFGYSMGGYVALALAIENSSRVEKIATLGTVLQWNNEIAERECRFLDPEKIKEKVPHFAEKLAKRHSNGWERVVDRTREMLQHLGSHPTIQDGDWKNITQPIRFHVGDRDTTAGVGSTLKIYNQIDHAELCVLPNSAHPIKEIKKQMLSDSLIDFF